MHQFSTLLVSFLLWSFVSFGKAPGTPLFNTGTVSLADGKQLAVDVTDNTLSVKRLNADGSQDMSFGTNGITTELVGGRGPAYSFTYIQPDGKIDIIGYSWIGAFNWYVLRLNPDGTKDGFTFSGFGVQNVFPIKATMDCGGRLIIVGQESHDIALNFGVSVYNPDLSINSTLSTDFTDYTPVGQPPMSNDIPNAVYSINDDRILVTGYADGTYAEALYGWNELTKSYQFLSKYKGTPNTYLPFIAAPADLVISTDLSACTASNVSLGSPIMYVSCYQSLTNDAPAVFPKGTTTVTWTLKDINGLTNTATQQVTVNDSILPQLTAPAAVNYCIDPSASYIIPRPRYSDNCSLSGISYQITGTTNRSSTGDDASGLFNPGTSTITWHVVDMSGNTTTAQTTVNIGSSSLQARIISSTPFTQGPENTVYLGYQPASAITLTASLVNDNQPASYLWSNGSASPSITVAPSASTTYSVIITNSAGCSIQLTQTIKVVDVRCGNKMDKVALCRNGNDICVSANAVPAQLRSGATLGSCMNSKTNGKESLKQSAAQPGLSVDVLSNPSPSYFVLNIHSTNSSPVLLTMISADGQFIEKRSLANSQNVPVGQAYRPGVYYATVVQGSERVILKLVKLKE